MNGRILNIEARLRLDACQVALNRLQGGVAMITQVEQWMHYFTLYYYW